MTLKPKSILQFQKYVGKVYVILEEIAYSKTLGVCQSQKRCAWSILGLRDCQAAFTLSMFVEHYV